MFLHKRSEYNDLPPSERESLLRGICSAHPDFAPVEMARFSAFGQVTDTGVFRHRDGGEFVFVPGDAVTLGWDGASSTMDAQTRAEITEVLEEFDITDIDGFLRDSCTPVRSAVIGPMLVEREVRDIGWYNASPDDSEIQKSEKLQDFLDKYLRLNNPGMHELHNSMKLQYIDGNLQVQLYRRIGYPQLLESVRKQGFDLPTQDEWEYLCGGGLRTLWRWGDSFDYSMKVQHFKLQGFECSWDISRPNQFGLVIGFDPYRCEVISGETTILKAGDGGSNICGGMGLALGFLPVATYYKGYDAGADELEYMEDIGGDYTSYRRILRL